MSLRDLDDRPEIEQCEGQIRLDLPDPGPVDETCSLCMGGGSCPQCSGSGTTGEWDEQRLAENADLRRAIEAAVAKLREPAWTVENMVERGSAIASDLERAIGVPW